MPGMWHSQGSCTTLWAWILTLGESNSIPEAIGCRGCSLAYHTTPDLCAGVVYSRAAGHARQAPRRQAGRQDCRHAWLHMGMPAPCVASKPCSRRPRGLARRRCSQRTVPAAGAAAAGAAGAAGAASAAGCAPPCPCAPGWVRPRPSGLGQVLQVMWLRCSVRCDPSAGSGACHRCTSCCLAVPGFNDVLAASAAGALCTPAGGASTAGRWMHMVAAR